MIFHGHDDGDDDDDDCLAEQMDSKRETAEGFLLLWNLTLWAKIPSHCFGIHVVSGAGSGSELFLSQERQSSSSRKRERQVFERAKFSVVKHQRESPNNISFLKRDGTRCKDGFGQATLLRFAM